jgi:YfiH family protein
MEGSFRKDGALWRAVALERLEWLEHGFGTRHPSAWPPAERTVWLRQTHSNRVWTVDGGAGCLGEGDALVTGRPGLLLAVRTADCLPILMVETERRVVASIHAGWRGTAAGISIAAVETLCRQFGGRPEHILVAIGPGIGPCCYEVGPEVAVRFAPLFPELASVRGKVRLDLVEANRRQLQAVGVAAARIHTGAPCTSCHPGEFHSHRRAPTSRGRMVSAIGIRAG